MRYVIAVILMVVAVMLGGCFFVSFETKNQPTLDKDLKAGAHLDWADGAPTLAESMEIKKARTK